MNRLHRYGRTQVQPLDAQSFQRMGTVFGPSQAHFLALWIGRLFLLAAAVAGLALLFPAAPYGNVPVAGVATGVAGVFGIVLLAGVADEAPIWFFEGVIACSSVLACVGVYGGGSPTSGAQFFFVWLSPFAFAFFTLRQAMFQVLFLALSYGAVLALQVHQHPGIGSPGLIMGMWITTIATVLIIGVLIRRISTSLRDVDQRMERAFDDSPIGSAFLTRDLVFLQVNPALSAMMSRGDENLVGRSLESIVNQDDTAIAEQLLREVAERTSRREVRFIRGDDSVVASAISASLVTPQVGNPYVFMQFVDITDQVRDRDALAHRAIHDPLTGLFNRALLGDRLAAGLRHRESDGAVAVVMLDLDQFKVVNDSLGHQVGDHLLEVLAPRLSSAVHPNDTLARFGGDEFVVLCEDVRSPLDALNRANDLVEALRLPVQLPSGEYTVSASVGVAVSSSSTEDGQALLRDADAAMYRAKAAGRRRIEIFDQSMREQAVSRLELENDLRNAAERGEFEIEYQPIVDLANGRVVMLEALLRWNHPVRGQLQPSEFIPLAEDTGLILGIGDYVIGTALEQLAHWQQAYPMVPACAVTVNVSGRQLADESFCDRVASALRTNSILPRTLGVELTESILLAQNLPPAVLGNLRALGVAVLLDDFGTGYSSLAYLEQFPIDILKVDQAFVARLDEGPHRAVVLEAILSMARALQLQVIVEGAENEERIRTLRALGCNWAQGHAICRPMPVNQVDLFLAEQQALFSASGPSGGWFET